MRKFFHEFKEFILRGNVISLAVGVLIGGAFQGVVTSLTTNIISPVIGLFVGANFDGIFVEFLGVKLMYGAFITSVINFLILAFVVFIIIKGMNRLMEIGKPPAADAPPARKCPYCMTELQEGATRCPACTSQLS